MIHIVLRSESVSYSLIAGQNETTGWLIIVAVVCIAIIVIQYAVYLFRRMEEKRTKAMTGLRTYGPQLQYAPQQSQQPVHPTTPASSQPQPQYISQQSQQYTTLPITSTISQPQYPAQQPQQPQVRAQSTSSKTQSRGIVQHITYILRRAEGKKTKTPAGLKKYQPQPPLPQQMQAQTQPIQPWYGHQQPAQYPSTPAYYQQTAGYSPYTSDPYRYDPFQTDPMKYDPFILDRPVSRSAAKPIEKTSDLSGVGQDDLFVLDRSMEEETSEDSVPSEAVRSPTEKLLTKREQISKPFGQKREGLAKCSKCGASVRIGVTRCPYCRAEIREKRHTF